MKPSSHRPLTAAIATILAFAVLTPVAHAQQQASSPTMREQRAKRMAELGKGKEEAKQSEDKDKPVQYPNATRTAPDAKSGGKMVKNLQARSEERRRERV